MIKASRLSSKIATMLGVFFLVAVGAIAMTLHISWQLEGGAAAINDAGSQRMRAYRIGHLMERGLREDERAKANHRLLDEMARFDEVIRLLEHGDPIRPLAAARTDHVRDGVAAVYDLWQSTMRPVLDIYLTATSYDARLVQARIFDSELDRFVRAIDVLVARMEQKYAFDANLLRTFQVALAVLSFFATAILMRFFFVLVVRPVKALSEGIRRMSGDDFSARLPVESRDEFGVLARGFNHMAEHLQGLYATLEDRVTSKTQSLAEKNQELAILYEATAFLNEPVTVDELCQGFLARIKQAFGAQAGAIRLYVPGADELVIAAQEGLSGVFMEQEMALRCGECVCGGVLQSGVSVSFVTSNPPLGMKLNTCVREGFGLATVFAISHNREAIGVFNLYFADSRTLDVQETHLLETLGTHLGVAIENLRLKSREKELAVFEERNLLAQELHDSIAQGLAFLNIQAQLMQDSLRHQNHDEAMATLQQIRTGIQESYDDVRELLVHFRTRVHQADLDSAIVAALEKFESQTGIRTEFERLGSGIPLRSEDEIQIIHIVQESLSNIRKHACATRVAVHVERGAGGLQIEISDNGDGFDMNTNPALASDHHVGLKIMKERAARAGGQCAVASEPGKGTKVTLTMPRMQKEHYIDD